MLEHRQDAAFQQPRRDRAGNGRHFAGFRAIGAVADDRIGLRNRDVGNRQAIDIDTQSRKIGRDQAGAEPRRGKAGVRDRGRNSAP